MNRTDIESIFLEAIWPSWWMWTLIVLFVLVYAVGLAGNFLVCSAVYRNRSMRTVTNYFIMNLAIADFLVIFTCLPPTLVVDVTMTWFFGSVACKIVMYFMTVSVTVSVLTLSFISIERWYAICFPLKFKSTTGRAKSAIAIIWIVAFILDVPELVVYEAIPDENFNGSIYHTQCVPTWSERPDQIWTSAKMLVLYFIPLCIMGVAYYNIISVLRKSSRQQKEGDTSENTQLYTFPMANNASTRGQLQTRKKAAKMLVSVVVVFAICYLPVHTIDLLRLFEQLPHTDLISGVSMFAHWLVYLNSAVNPVIYNFMSGKFRKEFKRSLHCCSKGDFHHPNFKQLESLTRSRTSSRQSQQKSGSNFRRTETVISKITSNF